MLEIIGVKQLYKDIQKIAKRTAKGESFLVVSRSKPIFEINPHQQPKKQRGKKRTLLEEFEELQFNSGEKDLSKKIDKIVYGV